MSNQNYPLIIVLYFSGPLDVLVGKQRDVLLLAGRIKHLIGPDLYPFKLVGDQCQNIGALFIWRIGNAELIFQRIDSFGLGNYFMQLLFIILLYHDFDILPKMISQSSYIKTVDYGFWIFLKTAGTKCFCIYLNNNIYQKSYIIISEKPLIHSSCSNLLIDS